MEKTGFFEEAPGQQSSMRLMSFISFCISGIMGLISFFQGDITYYKLVLIGLFLVGGFAPKAVQKFAEGKINSVLK